MPRFVLLRLLDSCSSFPLRCLLIDIQNEPDLTEFAAPGVNTFVTYGYGVPTLGFFRYDFDFTANASIIPALPVNVRDKDEKTKQWVLTKTCCDCSFSHR
jgi:hypothetical protein